MKEINMEHPLDSFIRFLQKKYPDKCGKET